MLLQSLLVLLVVAIAAGVVGVLDLRTSRRRRTEAAALWRLRASGS